MIYLDNAATTRVSQHVLQHIQPYMQENFFNASASYSQGVSLRAMLLHVRECIATCIHAKSNEIVFTGNGSESNNMAIKGSVKRNMKRVITSMAEHACVYETCKYLKNQGVDVVFLGVNACGQVNIESLQASLTQDTQLVSIMHVNNETGAINDIASIGCMIKRVAPRCLFHVDAIQSFGKIDIDVVDACIDMLSFSAHKLHGLKGVGGLYVKKGVSLQPLIHGGGQNQGLRSGTEPVYAIMSLKEAMQQAVACMQQNYQAMYQLKEYCIQSLQAIDKVMINSPLECTSPYILNVSVCGVRGEVLQHSLEQHDILIGLGSACATNHKTTRMTQALGIPQNYADGTIRLSFGVDTTLQEVKQAMKILRTSIECLRA